MSRNVPIENLLTPEQLIALGKVAAYSAELEDNLGFVIWLALKVKQHEANAILDRLSLNQRIDLLEKIGYGEDADVDDGEHFDLLIKNLRTLNGERNTVIHGQWGMKGEKVSLGDLVLMMTGPMPSELIEAKNKRRTFSPGDLIQLADDLHGASMLVWDLHRQFVKYLSDG